MEFCFLSKALFQLSCRSIVYSYLYTSSLIFIYPSQRKLLLTDAITNWKLSCHFPYRSHRLVVVCCVATTFYLLFYVRSFPTSTQQPICMYFFFPRNSFHFCRVAENEVETIKQLSPYLSFSLMYLLMRVFFCTWQHNVL